MNPSRPIVRQQRQAALQEDDVDVERARGGLIAVSAIRRELPAENLDSHPRRVADHRVEPAARPRSTVGVEEDLRELELPVEGAADVLAETRAEVLVGVLLEWSSEALGGACEALLLVHVGLPARDRRVALDQRLRLAGEPLGEHVLTSREQGAEVSTHQRVALAQVVQEREWLVRLRGGEPQSESRQLDRERVEVHAVEAALRHEPLDLPQLETAPVRRVGGHVLRDVAACADQEVGAAHGRVEDPQLEKGLERFVTAQPGGRHRA